MEPTAPSPHPKRGIRWMRWVGALAVLLALFAVIGFFVAPPIVKSQAEKIASEQLGRKVTLGGVEINPFTLRVALRDLAIADQDRAKPLFAFERLEVDAEWLTLFKRGIVIRAVTLTRPAASVVRFKDGRYNFTDIVEKFSAGPKNEPGPPPRFSVNNIRLIEGRVDFDDRAVEEQHALTDLNIGVPFVSSFPADVKIDVKPELSAKLNGDPLGVKGDSTPFADDLDTTLALRLEKFHFARYLDYVPMALAFKVPAGELTAALDVEFKRGVKGAADTLLVRGTASVDGLAVTDAAGKPLVAWKSLVVKLREIDVTGGKGTIESVTLNEPAVHAERTRAGEINLLALVPAVGAKDPASAPAKPAAAKPDAKPFALEIERIALEAGRIEWSDAAPLRPFRAVLSPINAVVTGFNLPGERGAEVTLDAKTDAGGEIEHRGRFALAPLAASGELSLKGVRAKWLAPYYEHVAPVIIDDGTLEASASYSIADKAGAPMDIAIAPLRATIDKTRLLERDGKTERAAIGRTTVAIERLDLTKRVAIVERAGLENARVVVVRNKDGSINWTQSLAGVAVESAAHAQPAAQPSAKPAAKPAAPAAEPDWTWQVKSFDAKALAIRFEDRAASAPVALNLAPTEVSVQNLASAPNTSTRVALKTTLDRGATIVASGPITLAPLAGALALDVRGLPIQPFQPYFADAVNIVVNAGNVTTQGSVGFAQPPDGPISVGFQGDLTVADLDTADKVSGERLLRWKSLLLSQLRVGTSSKVVDVSDIALTDFFARIIVTANGRLNLQDLIAGNEAASADPKPEAQTSAPSTDTTAAQTKPPAPPADPATAPDIRFSKITLQNGNVNFSDFFIRPNYSANLTNITGGVTEITAEKAGDVLIRGRVDNSAPLEVSGQVNPLAKDLFLDIRGEARDIDLPPFTPYAAKYAGYGIEKGKLSFKVDYKIKDRKLAADNTVILDQLTFGQRIESPTATKLPVLLAVALLKDRNGVIDLNLPITGTLDDPQFSVGGLIWRAVLNLLTKAVVAPFSLIAAAFSGGGSEELSFVEFEAGANTFGAKAEEKLATLTKALTDRPNVKLDIAGRIDPATDREAMQRARLAGLVRAQKIADMARTGNASEKPETVQVSVEEYPRFLEAAWRAQAKPARGVKPPPTSEMEKLLADTVGVTDEDLRRLANERSQRAKDALVAAGIAGERVFITAPKLSAEGVQGGGATTRAEFALR